MQKLTELSPWTIAKYIILIAAIGFIVALFTYNQSQSSSGGFTNPHTKSKPWNDAMVMGSTNAPNRMVEYTDYFCSFCSELHDSMTDEFKKTYIDSGLLSFETRIVGILQGVSANTPTGNQAAFCAADQRKYWEYSDEIIHNVKTDYFDKGIGVKNVAKPVKIPKLDNNYFVAPAKKSGLDVDKFSTCLKEKPDTQTINQNTQRAYQMGVNGLPNITINDYNASGFGGGGYKELQLMLQAGGVKKA